MAATLRAFRAKLYVTFWFADDAQVTDSLEHYVCYFTKSRGSSKLNTQVRGKREM